MRWKKFYSLPSLIKAGRKAARTCQTVSFDLFDTLLIRRIHDPDMVKLPVARYISSLAGKQGIVCPWYRVQEIRDTVEQEQRRRTAQHHPDHEACYPLFMREALSQIFGPRADLDHLLEQVTDFELHMENRMLVPRQELVDWLRELHRSGKRIFILSDVYLPSDLLCRLIRHAGFLDSVEAVLSSADRFQAKASGLGFDSAATTYGLDFSSWLHIGDNPFSDGLRPAEKGIRSLVLRDFREKHRKAVIKRYVQYSAGKPFWRGRSVQQLMLPLEAENPGPCSPLYAYGHNVLAPLLCAFMHAVANQCLADDIRRLYFFSREGWLLQKIWQRVVPELYPLADLPKASYLYVSRMALAGASCAHQGLVRSSADIVFLPEGNRDFRDICRVFSLDPEPFVTHLARYELTLETVLSPLHEGFVPRSRLMFTGLLDDADFQEEVRRQCREPGLAVEAYLEQEEFFKYPDVGLVDIGWLGTIQRFLFDAVKHRHDAPACHGFLFAATRGIEYPTSKRNRISGVIYDRHRFELAASSILQARDLFEEACRAPHPTLTGYRLTGSEVNLVFRDRDDTTGSAEQEQDKYFQPLQQGILDGAMRYGPAVQLLGHTFDDLRPWLNYLLLSRFSFPKTTEVTDIRYLHHLDDFQGQAVPVPGHAGSPTGPWECSPRRLRLDPLLRLKFFLSMIRQRLRE